MLRIHSYLAKSPFVKELIIAFSFSLLFILLTTSALPAFAVSGSSTSSLSEGLPNLENVWEDTEEFMYSDNRMPDMQETQKRTDGGLNSIQGKDDADKMIQPEDAKGATTTLDNIKEGVDKLLNND